MELTFKFLHPIEIKQLSKKEKLDYYKQLRAYTANDPIRKRYVLSKKMIHPLLVQIMKQKRIMKSERRIFVIRNEFAEWLKNVPKSEKKRPIIFNITHIGKFDIETVGEKIKKNFILLSGDQENLIDDKTSSTFLSLNGVYYFDMDDPEDRKNAQKQAVKILKSGLNLIWCGEGTWNFTDNLLFQEMYPGFVWGALEANALVVNAAINQVGNDFTLNIEKPFDPKEHINPSLNDKENVYAIKKLIEEEMWTLMWDILEHEGSVSRKDVSREQFEAYIDARLAEWPGFTRETVANKRYVNKRKTEPEDVTGYFYKYNQLPRILNPLPEKPKEFEEIGGKQKTMTTRLVA